MRILAALTLLPLLTQARVCGSDEAPTVQAVAKAGGSASLTAIAPTHGGQIVYADTMPLEVVVKADGAIQAYPVAPPAGVTATVVPPTARVTVNVPVASGPARPVRLAWRGNDGYFHGEVRGAVVAPGPVNVIVVKEGVEYRSLAPVVVTPVVVAAPTATVAVQRPATTVVVQQPSAAVVVQRPATTVVVQRPAAAVVVQPPSVAIGVGVGVGVGVGGTRTVIVDDDRHHDEGYRHHHDNGRHNGWDRGRGHGMH